MDDIEENFTKLLAKIVDLGHLVERRNELYAEEMDGWLHITVDRERELEEITSKLNELKLHGFQYYKRVIENLNAVNILIEMANASLVPEMAIGEPARAFSQVDIMIITSKLSESNIIRCDLFGKVYKGKFRNGKQVIVKVLRDKDVSEEIFMSEVQSLSQASHRNLLKLYGYCFEDNNISLVYEYMEINGSFDKILYQNPLSIEWDKFYDIAIKTAKAIAYLHDGCDEQIIHHNIKAGNVLLDENFSPKVAEFGVAKLMKNGRNLSKTPGNAAPEMWIPSLRITCSCDVYSFGMMLFEILGMRENTRNSKVFFPKHVWKKFESGELEDVLEECGISGKDKEKARTLALIALWCVQFKPKVRPSMSTVVKMLEMEFPVKNLTTDPFKY